MFASEIFQLQRTTNIKNDYTMEVLFQHMDGLESELSQRTFEEDDKRWRQTSVASAGHEQLKFSTGSPPELVGSSRQRPTRPCIESVRRLP